MVHVPNPDAVEAGKAYRQGGWRVGLLIARQINTGNMTLAQFASDSGLKKVVIRTYLEAWQAAHDANYVSLEGTNEDELLIEHDYGPDQWFAFYRAEAGHPRRVGDLGPAYEEAAEQVGTTLGQAIRVGSTKKGIKAAIIADPEVRETAIEGLVESSFGDGGLEKAKEARRRAKQWREDNDPESHRTRYTKAFALLILARESVAEAATKMVGDNLDAEERINLLSLVNELEEAIKVAKSCFKSKSIHDQIKDWDQQAG